MWRSILLWTFALVALGVWSAWVESMPPDPARRADAKPARLQLFSTADLPEVDSASFADFLLERLFDSNYGDDEEDIGVLDGRLFIHAAPPELREAFEAVRLADAGALDEVREIRDPRYSNFVRPAPAERPTVLKFYPLSRGCLHNLLATEGLEESTTDWEYWFTETLEASAVRILEPDPAEGYVFSLPGCVAVRNLQTHHERMAAFLAMIERRHGEAFGRPPATPEPPKTDPYAYELLPMGFLRPLPDDLVATDKPLLEYWQDLSSDYFRGSCRAGMLSHSRSGAAELARKHLADPAFVAGVRRLRRGSTARRVQAFQEILLGSDAQLQSFALWDVELLGQPAASQTVPALLTIVRERRLPEDLPAVVHERLLELLTKLHVPSVAIAKAVRDMSARAEDPDKLPFALLSIIDSPHDDVRLATRDIIIERLPLGFAARTRFSEFKNWLPFETEELHQAMADRAAEFLAGNDPAGHVRACRILVELDVQTPRAMELMARAVQQPQLAEELRAANEEVAVRAVRECLRNSDPDVRRAACKLLQAWNRVYSALDDLEPLLGDPLMGDAAKQALTRPQE